VSEKLLELVESLPLTLRIASFAQMIGVSERTIFRYINDGLPILGHRGHARVIPVATAIEWLRTPKRKRGRPPNLSLGHE
jgi:phage terminase Nu1 subunit (DNA packaging protein)